MDKRPPKKIQRRDLRVMVVDDNSMDRLTLCASLTNLGFEHVQVAEDGKIAEFKLRTAIAVREAVHLILVDWTMPGLNGLGLLKLIRGEPAYKDTVVFIVTGTALTERVTDAIKNGVNDFLVKPVLPDSLEKKLKPFFEWLAP